MLKLRSGDTPDYGSGAIPDLATLQDNFIDIYEPKKTHSSNIGINHLRNMSVPWYFDKIHDFRDKPRYFKEGTSYLNTQAAKVKKNLHSKSIIACLCTAFSKPISTLTRWRDIKKFEALIVKTIFHSVYKRYLEPFYENPHYRIQLQDATMKQLFDSAGYKEIPIVTIEEKDGKKVLKEIGDWGSGVRAATTFHHNMMDSLNPDKKLNTANKRKRWFDEYHASGVEINKNLHLQCDINAEKKYTDEPKTQEKGDKYYYEYDNIKLKQEKPIPHEPETNKEGAYKIICDNRSPGSKSTINDGKNEYYNGSWRFLTNRTDAASSSTVSKTSTGNILNPKGEETLSVIVPFIINGVVGDKASDVENKFNEEDDKDEKVKFIKENAGKLFQEKPIAYYLRIDKKRSIGKRGDIPEDYELKFTFVQPGIANDSNPGSQKIETKKWVPIRANTGNEIGWTLGGDDRMPNDLSILASFISLLVMDNTIDSEFERFIGSFHYMYDDADTKESMDSFINELTNDVDDNSTTDKFGKLKEVFVQLMTLGRKSIGYKQGDNLDEDQKQYLITFVISALVHLKTLGDYLMLPEAFALKFLTDNTNTGNTKKNIVIYSNDGFLKFGQGVFFNCDELIYSIDGKDYTGKHLKKILDINDEISFVDPTEKWKKYNLDMPAKRRRLTVHRKLPSPVSPVSSVGQSGGGKFMIKISDLQKLLLEEHEKKNINLEEKEEKEQETEYNIDEIYKNIWRINGVAMQDAVAVATIEKKKVPAIVSKKLKRSALSTEKQIQKFTEKVAEFSGDKSDEAIFKTADYMRKLDEKKERKEKDEMEAKKKGRELSMTRNDLFKSLIDEKADEVEEEIKRRIKEQEEEEKEKLLSSSNIRKEVVKDFWRIIITENEKVTMATWWYILGVALSQSKKEIKNPMDNEEETDEEGGKKEEEEEGPSTLEKRLQDIEKKEKEEEEALLKEISIGEYGDFQKFCLRYLWARFENCKEPVKKGNCKCLPTTREQTKELKQETLNKMRRGIMLRVSKMDDDQLEALEKTEKTFEEHSIWIDKHGTGEIKEPGDNIIEGDLMEWWEWAKSCICCNCMPTKCCALQGGKKTTKKRRRRKKKTRKRRRKKKRTKKKRRRRKKKTRGKR
jgi:hypothetical protein